MGVTQYVSFITDINQQTTEVLMGVCADFCNKGVEHIYLLLSTPGGNVMNGITLYNYLRGIPAKLTTHNIGAVNSIGNVIFLAGEERFACQNSTFMFHGVGFDIIDKTRFEEKNLREKIDAVQADQRGIGNIIAQRTKIGSEEVQKLFLRAETRDPDFAAAHGIIQEIREFKLPKGAPLAQLVFKR